MRRAQLVSILIAVLIACIGVAFADSPVTPYPAGGGGGSTSATLPVLYADGGTAVASYLAGVGLTFGPQSYVYVQGDGTHTPRIGNAKSTNYIDMYGGSFAFHASTVYTDNQADLGSSSSPWYNGYLGHRLLVGTATDDNANTLQVDGGISVASTIIVRPLHAPTVPSTTLLTTLGTLPNGNYCYTVTATTLNGGPETTASPEACYSVASGVTTNRIQVNWTAVPNAQLYKVYCRTSGSEGLCATTSSLSWIDNGSVTPGAAAPTLNTSAGVQLGAIQFADGTVQATAAAASTSTMLPVKYTDGGTAIRDSTGAIELLGAAADGQTQTIMNSSALLSGGKIVSFRNNGTEKAYVDTNGLFHGSSVTTTGDISASGNLGGNNLSLLNDASVYSVTIKPYTLGTCGGAAAPAGRMAVDTTSGTGGVRTRMCLCTTDGSTFVWQNMVSGALGTTTTCP